MEQALESTHDAAIPFLEARPDARRILVIEDDVELMNVFTRIVERVDASVRIDWAETAASAIDRVRENDYQVILADYYLKGGECGLRVLESCRELQPAAALAMMSSMSLEDMMRLIPSPDLPLLRKPFTVEECQGFLSAALA